MTILSRDIHTLTQTPTSHPTHTHTRRYTHNLVYRYKRHILVVTETGPEVQTVPVEKSLFSC